MNNKKFSKKAQTIISLGATPAATTTTSWMSGTTSPTSPTPNRITRSQRELLLPLVAKEYQSLYDRWVLNVKVQVIPSADRKLHDNANISITFPNKELNDVTFYHRACFSTPNANGNTWNSENELTYDKHDSLSIHVVDSPQSLQLLFQYLMTSEDLKAYFPNASSNGLVYFEFPAVQVPNPLDDCRSYHINDFSVLRDYHKRYLEILDEHDFRKQAQHFSSQVRNGLAAQAQII